MNKRTIVIVFLIIFSSIEIFSQSGGLNLTLAFPQGEFKDNMKRTGIGGNAEAIFWLPSRVPFGVGLNLAYLNYGNETRSEPFSLTIPDVTVEVSRNYNIAQGHLLFRLTTNSYSVRPYLDLLFGGAYLFTETKIRSYGGNQNEVASSTNFDDWAWSYGVGGGLMYLVFDSNQNENGLGEIYLDFKARYIYGTEAEYLQQGSVTIANGRAYYKTSRSKTDLLTASLGVIVYFMP